MIPSQIGRYEIGRTLGSGAMGIVYDGFDPVIQRHVAVKVVRRPDPSKEEQVEQYKRFRLEVIAAGRLHQDNIVGVLDFVETDELAGIVMEFIDGPTLKSLLDQDERLPLDDIRSIMEDLLEGLRYSHGKGVVHRDIKPSNLLRAKDGRTKISDFGIARLEDNTLTQAGTLLGTPAYMSPEQLRGEAVDSRTDLYSAGVVLYQLVTGVLPFTGTFSAVHHAALNTEPTPPSQLALAALPSLDAVVRRAMAKRPDDRYPTAAAFAAAFNSAMTEEATYLISRPSPEPPPTAPPSAEAVRERAARQPVPRQMQVAGAAVLVLAFLPPGAGGPSAGPYRGQRPRLSQSPSPPRLSQSPSPPRLSQPPNRAPPHPVPHQFNRPR